jgi:hypothetical protein
MTIGITTKSAALALLSLAFTASQGLSAVVHPTQGAAMINQGAGFYPVNANMTLNPGDQVFVGPGGSAFLNYSNGCRVEVKPGAVVTVASQPPCEATANDGEQSVAENGGAPAPGGGPGTLLILAGGGIGLALAACQAVGSSCPLHAASASP